METSNQKLTRHALARSAQRGIPQLVIDHIIEFGESYSCRDEGTGYTLGKSGLSAIRAELGKHQASILAPFRDAYVVICNGVVVTVAWRKIRISRSTEAL